MQDVFASGPLSISPYQYQKQYSIIRLCVCIMNDTLNDIEMWSWWIPQVVLIQPPAYPFSKPWLSPFRRFCHNQSKRTAVNLSWKFILYPSIKAASFDPSIYIIVSWVIALLRQGARRSA